MSQQFPYTEINSETGEPPPRKERIIEITVILFLIVPSMFLSFFGLRSGNIPFVLVALSTIFRDLGLLFLVLFLSWRDREPFSRLGWTSKNYPGEIIWGVLLIVPIFYGAALLQSILQQSGFSSPRTPVPSFLAASGVFEMSLATILVIIVAFSEETLFRGYLILRFTQITKNRTAALILSSVIFALGHGYEGSSGVITVGAIGFVLGLIYVWRQSLISPIVIHFLQNFIAIVVLPLFDKK
ncbi:MAG: CPBP family intramembrane metalloprotease [Chitinispirillaceae bacterium]|nr:CPBP family intramembrane metalloprotease [Chitinispirillaceae bacterium]